MKTANSNLLELSTENSVELNNIIISENLEIDNTAYEYAQEILLGIENNNIIDDYLMDALELTVEQLEHAEQDKSYEVKFFWGLITFIRYK